MGHYVNQSEILHTSLRYVNLTEIQLNMNALIYVRTYVQMLLNIDIIKILSQTFPSYWAIM